LIALIINVRPMKEFQSVGCPGQRTYGHCSARHDPCGIRTGRKDQYNTRFARQTVGGPLILSQMISGQVFFSRCHKSCRGLQEKQNAAKQKFARRDRFW